MNIPYHGKRYAWLRGSAVWLTLFFVFFPLANIRSQIIPDDTLGGENSTVTPNGINRDRIDGGATRGANLFHSFEQFSIEAEREAYFANPEGIANIFSRVTGGDRSNIFGTLGVLGDANLFLINPNGILFGPDAMLDVRGAFHASTAKEIIFPDGNTFSALEPGVAPLLTMDVTVPVGVVFAGATSETLVGDLTLRGVDLGVTGDISLGGNTVTLNRSSILGLGSLDISSNLLRIRESDLSILGDVRFENDKLRIVQNSNLFVLGRLNIENDDLLMRNSQLTALDIGDALEAGGILEEVGSLLDDVGLLLGDRESVIREALNTNNRPRDIVISTRGKQLFDNGQILVGTLAGQGRNIQLVADNLDLSNSSRIVMFSTDNSQQGNLSINAGQIHLFGIEEADDSTEAIPNTIGAFNFDNSTSGNINITANDLLMTDSSLVITSTLGRRGGGNVDLNVDTLRISGSGGNSLFPSFLAAVAVGEENDSNMFPSGGDLTVHADEILLEEGSEITTTTVSSPGGQILVEADEVVITGKRETFGGFTSSGISSESYGQGNGGVVIVRGDSIEIDDSGDISTSNRRPDEPLFEGDNSELNTDRIMIFDQLFSGVDEELRARIPSTDFVNDSIDLLIDSSIVQLILSEDEDLDLDFNLANFIPNIGEIFQKRIDEEREIDQPGNAGDLFLFTDTLSVRSGSEIFARTRAIGDGGNIHIAVDDFLLLEGSSIGTTAGTDGAGGDGGDITIRADSGFIVGVRDGNGNISANAFIGDGGNVRITAQDIFGLRFRDSSTVLSDITASSIFGRDGEVLIDTLNVDVARGLEPLPDQPVAPDINDTCSVSTVEGSIAFFDLGQGGSPPKPDSMVESNDAIALSIGESDWIPLIEIVTPPSSQARTNTFDRSMQFEVVPEEQYEHHTDYLMPPGIFGPSCQSFQPSLQSEMEGDRHS